MNDFFFSKFPAAPHTLKHFIQAEGKPQRAKEYLIFKPAEFSQMILNHASFAANFGAPARHTLSHASKGRSADFLLTVFWLTLAHLHHCEPSY